MKKIAFILLFLLCFSSVCFPMDAYIKGYIVSIPYDNEYMSVRTTDNNLIYVKAPAMNEFRIGQEIEIHLVIRMLEDARDVAVIFIIIGAEVVEE